MHDVVLPEIDPVKPLGRLMLRLEREALLEHVNGILREEHALIEDVFGMTRLPRICRARRRIWWWLWDELGWTYPEIGRLFGRDHTAVLQGIRVCGAELGLVEFEGRGKRRAA